MQLGVRPPSELPDVEEVEGRLEGTGAKATKSLLFSVQLWSKERGLASAAEVERQVLRYTRQVDPKATALAGRGRAEATFVLRLEAKQCTDIAALNGLLLEVAALHNGPVAVEASFDRLVLLARSADSIFELPNVYPALRCYLVAGAEEHCLDELQKLQRNLLAEFADMSCMCTIVVEPADGGALPSTADVLQFVRVAPSFWRFVVFSLERTARSLADSGGQASVDPMPFLSNIAHALGLKVDDLSPASAALCLEPLLYMFGYGRFSLRVSPYCAFVAVLATAGSLHSEPLAKYFDLEKFYREVTPLLPQMRANNYRIGVSVGTKLKRLLKKCLRGNAPVAEVYSYFIDEKKREAVEEFARNLQCVVVHNNMDLGCVDSVRRCQCASVRTGGKRGGLAASCTSCI